ncbi:hypothetical protein BBP40_002526 [Aspergillus hancockii]|nr:hypothetical protein BBP40_002526 [Aspergillus hancockii]
MALINVPSIRLEAPPKEPRHHSPTHTLPDPKQLRTNPALAPIPINRVSIKVPHRLLHALILRIAIPPDIENDFGVRIRGYEFLGDFRGDEICYADAGLCRSLTQLGWKTTQTVGSRWLRRQDTAAVCLVGDGKVQASKGKASTDSTNQLDKASFHHSWYINEACLALAAPL